MGEVADRYKSIIETVINKYLKDGSNYSDTKLNYAKAVAGSVYGIIGEISGISSEILNKLENCRDNGKDCGDYENAYDSTVAPLLEKVVKAVLNELVDNIILESSGGSLPIPSEGDLGKILIFQSFDSTMGRYKTDVYVCVREEVNGVDYYIWKKLTND